MILDANAISALLDGDRAIEVVLAGSEVHHLATVALGEYRYGLESSRYKRELTELLDELETESLVIAVDSGTARAYAAVRHELKSAGTPIPEGYDRKLWMEMKRAHPPKNDSPTNLEEYARGQRYGQDDRGARAWIGAGRDSTSRCAADAGTGDGS